VRVAVDGQEAIESLRREGADLVVSDIEMPRLDGIGLTTAIKGDQHLAAIPVILVTSLDQPEQRERGACAPAPTPMSSSSASIRPICWIR